MFVKLNLIDGDEILVNINHIHYVMVDPDSGRTLVVMDDGKTVLSITENFNQATLKLKYEGIVK